MMVGLVLVLFATAALCTGAEWDAFQVTYGRPGYYHMPWTAVEATADRKWLKIDDDVELNCDIFAQPEDARVMLLFDKNGNIAGIRMAFLKEDILKKAEEGGHTFDFDYENNPMYDKGRYFGKELYYTTALFQSPEMLAAGGRYPIDKEKDDLIDRVFFKNNGTWTEVVKDECNCDLNVFSQGNCFAGMGSHYFLSNANEEDCSKRQPFFVLYNEGRLSGVGLSGFASFTKNPNTQSYYEDFPVGAIKSIFPNAPACMDEYVKKYGLINIHVYFTRNANNLKCPTPRWSDRCSTGTAAANNTSEVKKKKKCNLKKYRSVKVQ